MTLSKEQKRSIEKLEHIWAVDSGAHDFAKYGDINDLTGFIVPSGLAIPIPEMAHSAYLAQFENEVGLDGNTYMNEYGAIRCRPGRVFLLLDIPKDSLNVEISINPTEEQLNTLKKITSKVYYDFFGDAVCWCPEKGVSSKQFIKDVIKYWGKKRRQLT